MSSRSARLKLVAYSAVNVSRVRRGRPAARRQARRGRAILAPAIGLTLIAAVLAAPTTAHAHPLGNFSVNHVTTVRISDDEVRLRYLLDQAEIPTVQERGLSTQELLQRKRDVVLAGLDLQDDQWERVRVEAIERDVSTPDGKHARIADNVMVLRRKP